VVPGGQKEKTKDALIESGWIGLENMAWIS